MLKYKNGRLYFEGTDVARMAQNVGTPFFAYSAGLLTENYRKIKAAFEGADNIICYSVKSNSNIAVLNLLSRLGCGADIVSGGELFRCIKAGIQPEKIVFSGVGKTDEEIEYALKCGILMFNVESIDELDAVGRIAERLKIKAGLAIRVNPDVEVDTHHHITTGKSENKFGINFPHVLEAYLKASRFKYIRIRGIQMHIGSQIKESKPFLNGVKKLLEITSCLSLMGVDIEYLDMGGGFGIAYMENEKYFDVCALAREVKKTVSAAGLKLIIEPGRFISGPSGILVSKVIYTKYAAHKNFVIADAAMNDLIRPAFYGAYHQIIPVIRKNTKKIAADIVGPVCESGDFLAKGRRISRLSAGDLIAVKNAGAYGFVMSSNYNSRRRAAEVMVKGSKFQIVRDREKMEDLSRGERICRL